MIYPIKPTCPKCGSHLIRVKKRDGTSWCQVCGYETATQEFNRTNTETE